ncbi:MAG: hypothetical protein R3253_07665 [Longimicrobiales bacterium]|nr:hypothetical protein [Longimicrobiales bacterium]
MKFSTSLLLLGFSVASAAGTTAASAQVTATARSPLAVAEAALEAISREDEEALADLMIPGSTLVAIPTGGGVPRVTTREEVRAVPMTGDFVERGFDGEVRFDGAVATVRLPYDFYRDGRWSHCGVDVFTLASTGEEWLIASLVYTVEQPPLCEPHPDGPPGG